MSNNIEAPAQKPTTVRQVKAQNFNTHRHSNILKSGMKTNLVSDVSQSTRHSNYGQRQQRNVANNFNQGPQATSTSEHNPLLGAQQTNTSVQRAYASTKPQQRRATGRAGKNSAVADTSPAPKEKADNQQPRAQSRRQVPTHLFHPSGPQATTSIAIVDYASQPMSHHQDSLTNLIVSNQSNVLDQASIPDFNPPANIHQQYSVQPYPKSPHSKTKPQQLIQICRDHIQPAYAPHPPQSLKQTNQQQSSSVRRGSTVVKRASVLTQRGNKATSQGAAYRSAMRKNSNQDLHATVEHQIIPDQHLSIQQMSDQERLVQLQRKNSSLSRRDYQVYQRQQQQMFNNNQEKDKRRKSKSNPRQKISSNLRTIQPQNETVGGKVRVHRTNKTNLNVPQKYGYRNTNGGNGGPLEAYTTHTFSNGAGGNQVVFTSVDNQSQGISKRLSTNQLPTAFHVSQDVNPMHLQHINSMDRAASLDSACYDVPASGKAQQAQPISIRVTPKMDNITSEHFQANNMPQTTQQGFSHMLKQTILAQAQENQLKRRSLMSIPEQKTLSLQGVQPELEAALLSLENGQLTQNLMREFINAKQESLDSNHKLSAPMSNTAESSYPSSKLETLIQQLIVRKEITQSPNIQQRRVGYYNTNNITAAHQSLPAHQVGERALGKRTVQQITNFTSSLHNSNVLKQEYSAEDLLRIGRKEKSAKETDSAGQQQASPQRGALFGNPGKRTNAKPAKNSQQRLQKPNLKKRQPGSSQIIVQEFKQQLQIQQQNAESFGQLSGIRPQASASFINGANLNHTGITGLLDLNLSDTFGLPNPNSSGQNTQALVNQLGSIQTISVEEEKEIGATGGGQIDGEMSQLRTIENPSSNFQTVSQTNANTINQQQQEHDLCNNAQTTFLSIEQPQMLNPKAQTMASDASIDDVYHRTLNAYQNDISTLNEINRTRREISNRIAQHTNILKSIQCATDTRGNPADAPQSASVVIIDSEANSSLVNSKDASFIGYQQHPLNAPRLSAGDPDQAWRNTNMVLHKPLAISNQPPQQQMITEQQRHHFSTVTAPGADDSQQLSFLDSHGGGMPIEYASLQGLSLEPQLQQQQQQLQKLNVTTSPIVGRYRLKPVPGANNSFVPVSSKRQQAYDGQQQHHQQYYQNVQPHLQYSQPQRMLSSIGDKRTKSVRMRRPHGQQLNNSNNRGGGASRRQRDDPNSNKHRTLGVAVRNKFDSIAQVYNSGGGQNRDDYATASNSQQNFAGINSMIVAAGPPTIAQQAQQQAPQFVSQGASRRQIQTIDPAQHKSCTLQQTYGVAQKLTHGAQHTSVKRSQGAGSVPRQRQGGFQSNLRPPAGGGHKNTERSLSHNRNRAQHSFQQMNSQVAQQHTYVSAGSSQQSQIRHLHGSVQVHPNGVNLKETTISGSYVEGGMHATQPIEHFEMHAHSTVSPISTQHNNRSFKYRAKQVPAQQVKPRQGKSKSTSRGRGAVVANSTHMVEPTARKHSRIAGRAGGAQHKEAKQTQMSQQQVMHFRGSLLPQQTSKLIPEPNNSMRVSSGAASYSRGDNRLFGQDAAHSQTSPTRKTVQHGVQGAQSVTPESLMDHIGGASPEQIRQAMKHQQYKLNLINKITRGAVPAQLEKEEYAEAEMTGLSSPKESDEEVLGNEVSVGGQEIQALPQTCNTAPFGRFHNLRYSSAINEFAGADGQLGSGEAEMPPIVDGQRDLGSRSPNPLSQEAQDRQNQAMKLINEDNPFENPPVKQQNILPRSSVAMLANNEQVMSFVAAQDSTAKSIADKTTERESKNTNATMRTGMCVSSSAAASATLTNQFKSTQKRTISTWGANNASNQHTGVPQRHSLLGLAAMRRSETTEDSYQCLYKDAALMMSSMPMPLHSIRQVIAEEEPGEEQDERTTNKESNRILTTTTVNGKGSSGNQKSSSAAGGAQAATNGDQPSMGDTPKISSSDNVEVSLKEQSQEQTTPANAEIIIDEVSQKCAFAADEDEKLYQVADDDDEVYQGEESDVLHYTPIRSGIVPKLDIDAAADKSGANGVVRPLSQKHHSARYLPDGGSGYDLSARNNNMLCESDTSGVKMEDSHRVYNEVNENDVDGLTPEILATKAKTQNKPLVPKPSNAKSETRNSYERGTFMAMRDSKLIEDFPPQLTQSVHRKSLNSQAHSDDEVEVRRGLETDHARSNMGSQPELCQSTHSLLDRPAKAAEDKAMFGSSTDHRIIMHKKQKIQDHDVESRENLMTEEIEIDLNCLSAERSKPAQQARNNNYFASSSKPSQMDNSMAKAAAEFEDLDDEGEEEVVGVFDDSEEFKLGKLL